MTHSRVTSITLLTLIALIFTPFSMAEDSGPLPPVKEITIDLPSEDVSLESSIEEEKITVLQEEKTTLLEEEKTVFLPGDDLEVISESLQIPLSEVKADTDLPIADSTPPATAEPVETIEPIHENEFVISEAKSYDNASTEAYVQEFHGLSFINYTNNAEATARAGESILMIPDIRRTSSSITWTSSNTSVATINQFGLAFGLKSGTTRITATNSNNQSSTISITFSGTASTTPTPVPTLTPTPIPVSTPTNTPTPAKSIEISSLLGMTLSQANASIPHPFVYSVQDEGYTNGYAVIIFDASNRITGIGLTDDDIDGTYTLFGVYPGIRWLQAIGILSGKGWKPLNNSPDDTIYYNVNEIYNMVMMTENSSHRVDTILYSYLPDSTPTPTPTPTLTPSPTPTYTPTPTPSTEPTVSIEIGTLLGMSLSEANNIVPDRFVRYSGGDTYVNGYALITLDSSGRIKGIILVSADENGKYTLFGIHPGIRWLQAVAILSRNGWTGLNNRLNDTYYVNKNEENKLLSMTEDSSHRASKISCVYEIPYE